MAPDGIIGNIDGVAGMAVGHQSKKKHIALYLFDSQGYNGMGKNMAVQSGDAGFAPPLRNAITKESGIHNAIGKVVDHDVLLLAVGINGYQATIGVIDSHLQRMRDLKHSNRIIAIINHRYFASIIFQIF